MPYSPSVEKALKFLSHQKTSMSTDHIVTKILAELLDLTELKDENGYNRIIIEDFASNESAILFGTPMASSEGGKTYDLYHNEQPWGSCIVVRNIVSSLQFLLFPSRKELL